MICVYAITDWPEEPLPIQLGQQDEPLAKIVWRDVVAVVSTFNASQLSRTADELWRHEEVVEALMSDRAVVPVRFGTLLPSPQRVRDLLCRAYGPLVQDIERVRGQVEIGMRFLSASENSAEDDRPLVAPNGFALPGTGPGSAYLRARLARERERRDRQRAKLKLVRDAYELLASHANASRLDDEPNDRHGTSAAFLVPRDRILSFREIVIEVANAHPELALLCTGPWPAYSFVNAGERATSWSEESHAG
jgi:Gas vesicle synthesis protein GvpL/GvpF